MSRRFKHGSPAQPRAASSGWATTALFSLTLFLSAALLFTVQPMFAKMVLPLLGGAPAVWNACLVFYQAALLAGYLYAHLSLQWLGARRQAVLHLALLGLAWIALPIRVAEGWLPPVTAFPAPWLWALLTVSLGLPFFAVSANAPMLQAWFAQSGKKEPGGLPSRQDPYFLYAASNLGSLLGLFAYPFVMEAHLTLAGQRWTWTVLFGLLTALIAACAVVLWKTSAAMAASPPDAAAETIAAEERGGLEPISPLRRLRWLALSLVPSSLLMGVTLYITSECVQAPFLWVVPLALYLLTFVLVFARRNFLPVAWMARLQAVLIVPATMSVLISLAGLREIVFFGALHLAVFFVTAMVCHGQLAADRPPPGRLTEFYLWMSLGGVIGGLFSALAAPLIFRRALEYPLMMALACMLRPSPAASDKPRRERAPVAALLLCLVVAWGLRSGSFLSGVRFTDSPAMRLGMLSLASFAAFLLRRRPLVFGCAVAALAAISLWSVEAGTEVVKMSRSFFGILRVERDPVWKTYQLMHGTTIHGQQSFDERTTAIPRDITTATGRWGGSSRCSGPAGRWPKSACSAWAWARSPPTPSRARESPSTRLIGPWRRSRGTPSTSPTSPIAVARWRSSWATPACRSNMGPRGSSISWSSTSSPPTSCPST